MQRSRRLEQQRLLQREYGKQSRKQGWLEGGRCGILVEQLQTAVIGCCLPMPSLVSDTVAVPSPAHSLVHCSRSPAAVLGGLFCPILNRTLAAGGDCRVRATCTRTCTVGCTAVSWWQLRSPSYKIENGIGNTSEKKAADLSAFYCANAQANMMGRNAWMKWSQGK